MTGSGGTSGIGCYRGQRTSRLRNGWPKTGGNHYYFDDVYRLTNIKLNGSSSSAMVISYDRLSRRTGLTYENGATATYTWAINNDLTNLLHQFTD